MKVLNRLWADEAGFIVSTELMLIATILVIGMIVGLVSIRDQIVQELADVAGAISQVNQTFSYSGVSGHNANTEGSSFADRVDNCDAANDQAASGIPPACVDVTVPASTETP